MQTKTMIQLTTASAIAITSLLSTQNVYAEEVSSEAITIFELTKPTTIQTSEGITITGATHLERWLKYRMLQGDQNIHLADYYVLAGEAYNGTQFYQDYDKAMQQPELQGIFPEDSYIQDQEKTYDGYPIFTPQYYYDAETLKANLKAMRTFVTHEAKRVKAYKTEAGRVKAAYDIARNFKIHPYQKGISEKIAPDRQSYLFTLRTGEITGRSGVATLVYLVMKEAGIDAHLSLNKIDEYTYPYYDDIRVVINNKDYYVNPSRAVSAKNDANIWGGYLLMSEMDRVTMIGLGNDIDGDPKKLRSKLEFYNKKKQILDGDIIPALSKYLIKHNTLTKGSHQYVFRVDNHVVFAQNLPPTKLKKQLAKRYPKMKNIRIQLDPNYMKVSYKI